MIKIEKFRHIAIIANNYQKMVDFYSKAIGLKIVREFKIDSEDFRKGVGLPRAAAMLR
ncbi:MAG: hypothetical protein FD145_1370 [Candidatus Saganbacteria bacterium]|uniref:Glyoxalase/fosfomycin resistance/dioxygenase domain-containing protein n=1 Tax=Candidatus Saganbacteria bacterium TaxID=2575572 RepID=A0A833NZK2_UNCSA|nr:MAG: hypothetical protein FD145_1370 [Candidatus Saganbacteria bacterium]